MKELTKKQMKQPKLSLEELKAILKECNSVLDLFDNHFPIRTPLEEIDVAVLRLQQEVDNINVPKTVDVYVVLDNGLKMRFIE